MYIIRDNLLDLVCSTTLEFEGFKAYRGRIGEKTSRIALFLSQRVGKL